MTDFLKNPPKRFKSLPARGGEPQVQRDGGMYGQGYIRSVSVITRGEACGHDMWADQVFLSQVASAINSHQKGVKSRFTHPSISADGTGKALGRINAARVEGEQVIADLHFLRSARSTPDGDLVDYASTLAEEDPEMFGLSIAFEQDFNAMDDFYAGNITDGTFASPDPENARNLPHVRLQRLLAADIVDDPAANPGGLFHRDQQIAQEADELLSYAAGLSDKKPVLTSFNVDGDRAKQFFQRFCESHRITMEPIGMKTKIKFSGEPQEVPSEVEATEETKPETEEVKPDQDTVVDGDGTAGETPETSPPNQQLSTGQRFLDAFGDQGGVWFAQGKSFDDCQVLFTQQLREENEALKKKLSARRDDSEESAVTFENGDKTPKRQGLSSKIKIK